MNQPRPLGNQQQLDYLLNPYGSPPANQQLDYLGYNPPAPTNIVPEAAIPMAEPQPPPPEIFAQGEDIGVADDARAQQGLEAIKARARAAADRMRQQQAAKAAQAQQESSAREAAYRQQLTDLYGDPYADGSQRP